MSYYKVGDRSKAYCYYCNHLVDTIFKYQKRSIANKKRLVAYCSDCNEIVGVPQQEWNKDDEPK